MDALLLGIDVGTTGAKAVLIDAAGTLQHSVTTEYPLATPQPLWAEQDPADWWHATIVSIQQILDETDVSPERIAGVGLTGQMHGLVALDAAGKVLRPAILWNDQRTGAECAALTERVGAQRVLELTGNAVLPGFTAPKLLWLARHDPDVFARIAHVLLPKDYVRYRLTGEFVGDVSDASGTSLFDVSARRWSAEMCAAAGVPEAWLPAVAESPAVCGAVTVAAAERTGLRAGTPVVAGAGDQAAQALGTGITAEGVISVTLGTSGVVFAASDRYRHEPAGRLHAFCHAVPDGWHLMGVMLSAGGSFRWYRDMLSGGAASPAADFGPLTEAAAAVPPGCEGLVFLPYLAGERTPHPDPHARGAFVGLTLRHTQAHLTRSVLEGVSFGLRDSLELLREAGLVAREVRVTGGGARSPLWRQILADVFDEPVVTVNLTEGAAFGAALLAGVGAGVYADVRAAGAATVRTTGVTEPSAARSAYGELYPRYRALYPCLADEFRALGVAAQRLTPL